MRYIFTLPLIFIPFVLCAQEDDLALLPISKIGKLSTVEAGNLKMADSLSYTDYFFTETFNGDPGLYFIEKDQGSWNVYDFEILLNLGPSSHLNSIRRLNKRFLKIQFYRSPSGLCSALYGILILFDVTTRKYVWLFNMNEIECDDGKFSKCEAKISFERDLLKIRSSKKSGDGLHCFETGTYKFDSEKFIRLK